VPRPIPPLGAPERALHVSALEFVGALMGLALRTRSLVALNFPSIVWKHLVSDEITEEDVRAIDLLSFQFVDQIKGMDKKAGVTEEVFDAQFSDMKIEVFGADSKTYPLIPGGRNLSITWKNRSRYCDAYNKYRFTEFAAQCEAIRRGMAVVVPFPLLSILSWKELERMVTGSTVDIDLLEKVAQYRNCAKEDAHVKLFWRMLRERFGEEERRKFLTFVWGRSRLPTREEDFSDRFRLENYRGAKTDENKQDMLLPVSHTCMFSLELPKYSTLDIMTERVTFAMVHCAVIDGDGLSRHADIVSVLDEDDSPEQQPLGPPPASTIASLVG